MSECVVRMEMPQRCDFCDFWYVCKNVADFGAARYFEGPRELTVGMKGCKIVCPLPEGHGRLVDADAFISTIRPLCEEDKFAACTLETAKRMTVEHINNAPTIVPAERSETEQI